MFLYSSDSTTIKIILSKYDAKQLILKVTSKTVRQYIVSAIFKAALPKSKFIFCGGSITAKLIEYPNGKYMLEFTQNMSENNLYCYLCTNLDEISLILRQLLDKKAQISKLYSKGRYYYLLSEKGVRGKIMKINPYIDGILQEYASIISEKATEEVLGLL